MRKLFDTTGVRAAVVLCIVFVSGVVVPGSVANAADTTGGQISPLTNPLYWDIPGITIGGGIADGVKIQDVRPAETSEPIATRPSNEELCGQAECTWSDVFPDWFKAPFRWIANGLAGAWTFVVDKTKEGWTWLTWEPTFAWVQEPHADTTTFAYPRITAVVRIPVSPDQYTIRVRGCWTPGFNTLPTCGNVVGTNTGGHYLIAWQDVVYPACQANVSGCQLWVEYITGGNNSGTSNDVNNPKNWTIALRYGENYTNVNERPKSATTSQEVPGSVIVPDIIQRVPIVSKTTCVDSVGNTTVLTTTKYVTLADLSSGSGITITSPKCAPGKKSTGTDTRVGVNTPEGTPANIITTTNHTYTTNVTNEYVTIQKKEGDSWVWCAQGANCSTVTNTTVTEGTQYRCVAQDGTVVEGANCVEIVKRLNANTVIEPEEPQVVVDINETCVIDLNCWSQRFQSSVFAIPFNIYDDFLNLPSWTTERDFSQEPDCLGIGFDVKPGDFTNIADDYPYVSNGDIRNAFQNTGEQFSQTHTVYPFSVCNPRIASIAEKVRGFQAGVLYVITAWFLTRKIFRVLGMAELTEDNKPDTAEVKKGKR